MSNRSAEINEPDESTRWEDSRDTTGGETDTDITCFFLDNNGICQFESFVVGYMPCKDCPEG